MVESEKPRVLFDGDCGVCNWSAGFVRRLDRKHRFTIEPFQEVTAEELARMGLTREACSRALQVVSARGRRHIGAFGVNYILWRLFPWSLLVFVLYAIPILLLCEILIYAWVARNRQRVSRWFGLEACRLR